MTNDSTVPPGDAQDGDENLDTDSALFDQPDGTDWYLATIVDLATVLGVQQVT